MSNRQWPYAAKLLNFWFFTQNHPKNTKICIVWPKLTNFVQSNHLDTLTNIFFHTSSMCIETKKGEKVILEKNLKYKFLGVLAIFESF